MDDTTNQSQDQKTYTKADVLTSLAQLYMQRDDLLVALEQVNGNITGHRNVIAQLAEKEKQQQGQPSE